MPTAKKTISDSNLHPQKHNIKDKNYSFLMPIDYTNTKNYYFNMLSTLFYGNFVFE